MIHADLGRQLETFVAGLVETGRYRSESDVLREGVRIIQDREGRLAMLDDAVARGIADADSGDIRSADAVFDRLDRKYREQAGSGG